MARYALSEPQAKKLDKGWHRLYPMGSRMADLNARRGVFNGWDDDRIHKQMLRSAKIIKAHAEVAIALSCHQRDANEAVSLLGRRARGLGLDSPYAICCYAAIAGILIWNNKEGRKDEFAYVLEAGTKGQGSADKLLKGILSDPEQRALFRIRSIKFESKSPTSPLGAADMLAWEWGLEQSRRGDPGRRYPTRQSFLELLNEVPHRYYTHLAGKTLLETLKSARDAGF